MKFKHKPDIITSFLIALSLFAFVLKGYRKFLLALDGNDAADTFAIPFIYFILALVVVLTRMNRYVQLTDTQVIVKTSLLKRKVFLSDITAITRKEDFKIKSAFETLKDGVILKDTKSDTGETKIVIKEEKKFIEELLKLAPHIKNNL